MNITHKLNLAYNRNIYENLHRLVGQMKDYFVNRYNQGYLLGGVLILWRDAAGEFYSPSRPGY